MTEEPRGNYLRNPVFAADLLVGRTALVTGGGSGLGRGIAQGLANTGARVVIAARRREPLEEAATQLRSLTGAEIVVDQVDVRDLDSVARLAEAHPQVDILVNNAGGHFAQKARDLSPKGWRAVVDLNLNGTWNMTQAFGNRMLDGAGGTICQIVMTVGHGMPGLAHGAAARAGVVELVRTLAFEWGPRVRINAVAPGQVRTDAWIDTYAAGVGEGVGHQPLPFEGDVTDIANAVSFLVSPAARFITGQLLYVDGGLIHHGLQSALPEDGYPERALPPTGY